MSQVINVSRRGFLVGLAGAGRPHTGAQTVPKLLWAKKSSNGSTHADEATLHPNVFVGIDTDGTVYIVAHRSEMGTVIRTSPAPRGGGRARRRLEAREDRAGHWRRAIR